MGRYVYYKANEEVKTVTQVGETGDLNGRNTGVSSRREGVAGTESVNVCQRQGGDSKNVAPQGGADTLCLASP